MMRKKKFIGLYLLDISLGSVIGPGNFFAFMLLIGYLATEPASMSISPIKKLLFVPVIFGTGFLGSFLSKESVLMFVLPSVASTMLLTPFLFNHLLKEGNLSDQKWKKNSAASGIVFGLCASVFTGFFMGLAGIILGKTDHWLAVLVGTPVAVAAVANTFSLPMIVITGSLFGLINGFFLRKLQKNT